MKIPFIPKTMLEATYLGNTGYEYVFALWVLLAALLIFKIIQSFILHRLSDFSARTKTDLDDTFIEIVEAIRPPFYSFIAFYIGIQFLSLHRVLETAVNIILLIWVVYLSISAVQKIVDYAIRKHVGYETQEAAASASRFLSGLVKWVLWAIGALLVLSNLGVNITSLIAGLGVGGVAVAFALQNILGDLFSSFAIYFDKPFIVGDVIKVGEFVGEVEKIGIKTTRVKSLQGEEIVFSNNQLTSDVVQNFGRIEERRSLFTVGVTYDTPPEKLKRIPTMIKEIIESVDDARFDRSHFKNFGESALEIETSFYIVSGADYAHYLDLQQEVNLKIREKFMKEGIELAYPTQTIHLKR